MILVTADLHWSDNPRDDYRFGIVSKLLDIAEASGRVEAIVILGDLTEQKDRHSAWLVNEVVDSLAELAASYPVYVLRGNHDYLQISAPFFEFLRHIKGLHWIGQPTVKAGFHGIGRVLFLPHTSNWKRDWQDIGFGSFDWVLTHNTFEGAALGPGRGMRGIPLSAVKDGVIISGDIHVPQRFANITYVGAPYLIDFGDNYKPRALLISSSTYASIPLRGPQKRLIDIKTIRQLDKAVVSGGDIVKVRIVVEDREKWPDVQSQIREWAKNKEVNLYTIQPVTRESVRNLSAKYRRQAKSDDEFLSEYAARHQLDSATVKTGRRLLRDA